MWKLLAGAALLSVESEIADGALLRLRAHKGEPKMNPLEKISAEAGDNLDDAAEAGDDAVEEREDMPVMKGISRFRVQMCLGRPTLIDHEKCMKFMTKKCEEKSTGQGLCLEFFDYLEKHCKAGDKGACESLKELGELVEKPKPNVTETTTTLPPAVIPPNDTNLTNVTEPEPIVAPNITEDTGLTKKVEGPLPSQGYNEYKVNKSVVPYKDGKSHTADWHKEDTSEVSEEDATLKACKEKDTVWCKLYVQKYG